MVQKEAEGGDVVGGPRRYAFLARRLPLGSYRGKVLIAAFAGMHLPLIALILYAALGSSMGFGNLWAALAVALVTTLVGATATLYVLNTILTPVSLASQALRDYVERGERPELPVEGDAFVSDVQYTVGQVERMNRALQALEELSTRDYLTGAYNRRGCEQRLEEDLGRLRRSGGILTLAVLDVDRFKRINDEYGHQAGDACLTHVATVLQGCIRRGDWVARWGGDEFVLALWDAQPASSAGVVLDRLLNTLHETPARLADGTEVSLEISGGAYLATGDEDVRRCFALADDALRRAKREGRSRMIYES